MKHYAMASEAAFTRATGLEAPGGVAHTGGAVYGRLGAPKAEIDSVGETEESKENAEEPAFSEVPAKRLRDNEEWAVRDSNL